MKAHVEENKVRENKRKSGTMLGGKKKKSHPGLLLEDSHNLKTGSLVL